LATAVYEVLEVLLQDGTEVTVRPLDLKRLRKVMVVIDNMNKDSAAATELESLEYLIEATKISLEKQLPELVVDDEKFEDALDLPTMWKILEITAGLSLGNNPNLLGEAALPGLISN